ncbi:hypothetical protein, conserved [Thermococcus kodakarensis KOD1]|uniref:Uncharacterized protein n=1 Tax=Thermococcus kodakarensis (strain ATCC BAA-918 / JCM 12380 / KOD1) TaxID=69014 RepID=Q5JEV7_THEKO|nr:hypothetical protein [Thermococcus kodakarensis]WCN27958.1 hypothetical protein POG15_10720 [Thermococcus kodakarensis]WCN30257.1 hypothetical protein POG21_10705 [Thermococcus kodakarensis]BAD86294.1 hypothetical protein, conserved [Thermococcus kodakarensis KOD1]
MNWKKQLREDGYLEIQGFRIELTLDNTFLDLDYIPRIIVYDEKTSRWYVLRNPIPKGKTLEENWDNAVEVLEMIVKGEIEPNLGDEDVSNRFLRVLKRNLL